ncbi:aprataxin and PNK-like factor isoform X1 [Pygocentrus nattereri]|uniref:aprataxin and PNK-like factor isoform X1 n=1 Tax=Pygocentrus nattereri TaxID=42514 RepID=UPI0008143859|nr:aprataxin and PNK-like factor isoform X1 [Pygocentrus nattereri]XP_017576072.1 aprataxin and PNK-like factor isoform X1 [Pygocentrus nattereri]
MPGFELEQVDGGQPIDLPYGETVIGRGPFLGVSDKRVSRNHGVLENVDGQLRLKPTHLNPCFIQTSLGAPSEPLEKDQWHCLKEGSIFSLLPGKYVYRVRVITEDSTLSNSQGFEEETQTETEENSKPSRVSQETQEYNPQAKSSTPLKTESAQTAPEEEEKDEDAHKPDPTSCGQANDVSSPAKAVESAPLTPQRKRVLPAWMTAATPAAQSPSTVKAATKRAPAQASASKAAAAQSKRATGPKRARTKKSSSGDEEDEDDEEHINVEQKPRKRPKKLNSDTEESQDQAPAPKSSQERSLEDRLSEDSEEERKGRASKRAEAAPKSRAGGSTAEAGDSGNSEVKKLLSQNGKQSKKTSSSENSSSSSKPRVKCRTPCPYGTSCYRKNPVHFQECSHPGDDDFEEELSNSNEDDDDRPECPYGTDCYRKNPLHKKEYKHTKPPAKKSVPDDEDDDDDDDDDDEDRYENSFINDESEEEEVDEDSDYVPESDDGGKEDIKRLQKEAKAFLRRKK